MDKLYDFVYISGQNNILIINFSSKGIHDTKRVMPEMIKQLSPLKCHVGYAMDVTKSWFSNKKTVLGIQSEINTLQEIIRPVTTIFMGLSMGGYGAILFSYICKCDKVIAFSPQIDIDTKLTKSWDNRYIKYLHKIDNFHTPHIRNHFKDNVEYTLICCDNVLDKKHISLCPISNNISKKIIPCTIHNPLKYWKDMGVLEETLKKLIFSKENNE